MKQRKRYTPESKAQVVELVNAARSLLELAQEFELNPGQIHTWKRNAASSSHSQVCSGVKGAEVDMDAAQKLRILRKQVKELQFDSDIFKKGCNYSENINPNKPGE